MWKRNSLAEQILLLFRKGLSRIISKLSSISRTYLWCPYVVMVNSSKDGMLFQFRRWSRIALSFDGLTFLNVKGDILICSPDQSVYPSHRNRKNCTFHTYIYKPLQTLSRKVSDFWIRKHEWVSFDFWNQFEGYNNSKCLWTISLI